MENYVINDGTLAIIPITSCISEVYEEKRHFLVSNSTTNIMDYSCRYFGSSLEGRRKGTESLIGVSYKVPIIVEESNNIIFFPLSSTRNKDTAWIRLQHIARYYRNENGVDLLFSNGVQIHVRSSYGIIDNQILRATRLESALRGRKNTKKRFKTEKNVL